MGWKNYLKDNNLCHLSFLSENTRRILVYNATTDAWVDIEDAGASIVV